MGWQAPKVSQYLPVGQEGHAQPWCVPHSNWEQTWVQLTPASASWSHWPDVGLQLVPVAQVPQLHPVPGTVPQPWPAQRVLQLQVPAPVHIPEGLSQVQPVAQVPQELPQLSTPHCFALQLGVQLTQRLEVESQDWSAKQQAAPQAFKQILQCWEPVSQYSVSAQQFAPQRSFPPGQPVVTHWPLESQELPWPQVPQTQPPGSFPHCFPPHWAVRQARQAPAEHLAPTAQSGPHETLPHTGSRPQTCPPQSGAQGVAHSVLELQI